MKRILFMCLLLTMRAFAASCPISSGASLATQQSAINTCAATPNSTVTYAAGSYPNNGKLTVPTATNLTITGPVATPPTVLLTSNVANSTLMALHTGSVTISYLSFNGSQPAAGGGGSIYVQPSMSNITISHNNFQGNQGVIPGNETETLIWFDGTNPGTTDSTIVVTNNTFGGIGDCSAITSLVTDQSGWCGGIGIKTGMSTLTIENNTFFTQEEGIKFW